MENELKFVHALQMLLCLTNFENYMYHNIRILIRGRQHTLSKLAVCARHNQPPWQSTNISSTNCTSHIWSSHLRIIKFGLKNNQLCSNSSTKLVCLKGKHGCGHCETWEQKQSMQNNKTRRQPTFLAMSFHNGKCISKWRNPICG
jgi:hypothetical protein